MPSKINKKKPNQEPIDINTVYDKITSNGNWPLFKHLTEAQRRGGFLKEWLQSLPDDLLSKTVRDHCQKDDDNELPEDFFMCAFNLKLFEAGTFHKKVPQKDIYYLIIDLKKLFVMEQFQRAGLVILIFKDKSWSIKTIKMKNNITEVDGNKYISASNAEYMKKYMGVKGE